LEKKKGVGKLMLPSNLLITKISGGRISPIFAPLFYRNLSISDRIIEEYKKSIGKKKSVLDKQIQSLEDGEYDYRLIRGLSLLLERRCSFEPDTKLDPSDSRRLVFSEASRQEFTDESRREKVLKMVSSKVGVQVEELEKALWSDIDENLLLRRFEPIDSSDLLKKYNIALTQTLLFKSLLINFTTSSNWKNIFRAIKHFGLMYNVEQNGDELNVMIDGPISIFKMVERYGTSIAKLLPFIINAEDWRISGEILGRGKEKRIYRFSLSSRETHDVFPMVLSNMEYEYDSSIEKKFAKSFNSIDSGWILRREPEPLIAGSYVLIPDFSFEKIGLKIYLEIMGFWTKEYLEKKIQKLSNLKSVDLIIAVDKNLACGRLHDLGRDYIIFSGKLTGKEVYPLLLKRENEIIKAQNVDVQDIRRKVKGEYVKLTDLSKQLDISLDVIKKYLPQINVDREYLRVGDAFIQKTKVDRIKKRILEKGEVTLVEAQEIMAEEDVDEQIELLNVLGYEVIWRGLDPASSRLIRKER